MSPWPSDDPSVAHHFDLLRRLRRWVQRPSCNIAPPTSAVEAHPYSILFSGAQSAVAHPRISLTRAIAYDRLPWTVPISILVECKRTQGQHAVRVAGLRSLSTASRSLNATVRCGTGHRLAVVVVAANLSWGLIVLPAPPPVRRPHIFHHCNLPVLYMLTCKAEVTSHVVRAGTHEPWNSKVRARWSPGIP